MDARTDDKLLAFFKSLHREPELSWQELQTRRKIVDYLSALSGVEILFHSERGILCRLTNRHARDRILYRADIDALPIQEESGLDYASTRPGIMHACGHDGHITVALGIIEELLSTGRGQGGEHEFYFLFQAAEENLPSGARSLVDSGELSAEGPFAAIYAAHFIPQLPAGTIGLLPVGPATTGNGFFKIQVQGKSAHSSQPHLGLNPIPVAAQLIMALESMSVQSFDPRTYRVLSICQIHSGTVQNQIPESLELAGSLRVLSEEVEGEIVEKMDRVAQGMAAMSGVCVSLDYLSGHPPIQNDARLREQLKRFLLQRSPDFDYVELPFWSASEDFAHYAEIAPLYYLLMGSSGSVQDQSYANHHPRFKIAHEALFRAITFWSEYFHSL